MKDIHRHENQSHAFNRFHNEFSQLRREPWCDDEQLKQLYKTHMSQIKIKTFEVTVHPNICTTLLFSKVATLITWKPSSKKFIITNIMPLRSTYPFLSSFNIIKPWNIVISTLFVQFLKSRPLIFNKHDFQNLLIISMK